MGHEFSARVLEAGPDTETFAPGHGRHVDPDPARRPDGDRSRSCTRTPVMGGYAERMILSAPMLIEVPNGLDPKLAALTEPMAVGMHGVNRSGIKPGEGALVLGCGPVGLAIIAGAQGEGHRHDRRRRLLARSVVRWRSTMGATEAVDPNDGDVVRRVEARRRRQVAHVFEAIGVPGIINDILKWAPPTAPKVTVVGVCMEHDTDHAVLRHQQGARHASSALATTRWSSPGRCARSPRARST